MSKEYRFIYTEDKIVVDQFTSVIVCRVDTLIHTKEICMSLNNLYYPDIQFENKDIQDMLRYLDR